MKHYTHQCRNFTCFDAEARELTGESLMTNLPKSPQALYSDIAEFIGYHATLIHPDLNGFAGYDCLKFVTEPTTDTPE